MFVPMNFTAVLSQQQDNNTSVSNASSRRSNETEVGVKNSADDTMKELLLMYGAIALLVFGAGVAIVCCLRKMMEDSERENSIREETAEMQGVVDLDDGDGVMAILFGKTCGLMAACMKRVCCCCCFYDESMIEPEEVEMGQPQRLPKVCFPGTPAASQQRAPSLMERTYKRSKQAQMDFDDGERQPLSPACRLGEDGAPAWHKSPSRPGSRAGSPARQHADESPSSTKEGRSDTPKKHRRRSMTPSGTRSDSPPSGTQSSRKKNPTRSMTPGPGRSSAPNRRDVPPRLPPLVRVGSAKLVIQGEPGGYTPSLKRAASLPSGYPGTPANV